MALPFPQTLRQPPGKLSLWIFNLRITLSFPPLPASLTLLLHLLHRSSEKLDFLEVSSPSLSGIGAVFFPLNYLHPYTLGPSSAHDDFFTTHPNPPPILSRVPHSPLLFFFSYSYSSSPSLWLWSLSSSEISCFRIEGKTNPGEEAHLHLT